MFTLSLTSAAGRIENLFGAREAVSATINTASTELLPDRQEARLVAEKTASANTMGFFKEHDPVSSDLPPDHLAFARHAGAMRILLRFSDGCKATVDLADLKIDTRRLKLDTAKASSWGSALEIKDRQGKVVHIDSAVLRSSCDPYFAAELRRSIAEVTAR